MKVNDILAICSTDTFIMIESADSLEPLFEGKALLLHGNLRQATVDWLRPYYNGFCLKVTKESEV